MPETVRFRSRIEAARAGTATGGGAAAKIPEELVKALGGLKQMRMDAKLNGVAFKTSTMPYRGGFYVGVHKAVREQAGVGFGDEVDIELTRDDSPRVLELAPELDAALGTDPELRARFDALSFTRRKELSESIRTAVKPETRAARLEKVLAQLRGA
jgi:uncharacterized protein YdeI (YjbR/CyaY-like superfamily)